MEIVIIGLRDRADRWERCKEIIEKEGLKNVTRYITEYDELDPYGNASKDFYNLISSRTDNTLLFEDDFELTPNWRDVLEKSLNDLPRDFDLLYLGCNLTEQAVRITPNLARVRGAWTVTGAIFSKRFCEYIKQNYNARVVPDEYLRTKAPEKRFYMTYPMICYQRESWSDFAQKVVSYDFWSNKNYRKL